MPELPEAETIARDLHEAIVGRTLRRIRLTRPDIVRHADGDLVRHLRSRRVTDVYRRGKRIVLALDDGNRLVFALGMSGRITIEQSRHPCLPHTHLRMAFGDGRREIRFRDPRRFGGVWYMNAHDNGSPRPLPEGVEPLDVSLPVFRRLLRRKRQIKALLLDQSVIAGLGNIYCDEALHQARIHPLTRAADLTADQTAALRRAIRRVLRSAINFRGSTLMDYRAADGQPGRFQSRHRVYNRQGKPCRRCKTPIERILAASRSTHFCPTCQPRPFE